MSVIDKIKPKKGFKCTKCGLEFPDRKQLGKHIYDMHNDTAKKAKKIYLPVDTVKEMQYISKGSHVQLEVRGTLTDKGVEVSDIKYL